MEIHAPHGPVSNWREFIVHISILTNYSSMENQTIPIWLSVESFFNSHDQLSGQSLGTARERLQELRLHEGILEHLAGELQEDIDDTKKNDA